jgi:hypothetical protein
MADFEKVVRKHVNDEGNIPADSIQSLVQSIQKAVGEGFVTVDRYNAKKTQLDELQTKLDASEGLQSKYDKLKNDFDTYKGEQEAKETRIQKQDAYKEILKKAGIPEKRFAVILKTVDLDDLKISSDGKLENADKVEKSVKEEWSDFIVTTQETGVNSANPPTNNAGKSTMTKKEIMEIKDTAERQKAIAENHELFGF